MTDNENPPEAPPPAPEGELAALRADIDRIDDAIIDLIIQRTQVVQQVGRLKSRTQPGLCPLRPGREALQVRRVLKRFENSAFHPEAAASIWRSIINASLAAEGDVRISVLSSDGHHDLYWLAREYFGGFAQIMREPSAKRVIGDIIDGKAHIGVLPMLRSDEAAPWWPDLAASSGPWPKIFARIPFVEAKASREAVSAIAIGAVAPEETGDDVSFLAFESEDNTSMHRLQTAFAGAGLKATWLDLATHHSGRRRHLVELQGFITREHPAFAQFSADMQGALLGCVFLGAYATPISISNRK